MCQSEGYKILGHFWTPLRNFIEFLGQNNNYIKYDKFISSNENKMVFSSWYQLCDAYLFNFGWFKDDTFVFRDATHRIRLRGDKSNKLKMSTQNSSILCVFI